MSIRNHALAGLAAGVMLAGAAQADAVKRIEVESLPLAAAGAKRGESLKPMPQLPRIPGPVIHTRLVRNEDGGTGFACEVEHDHASAHDIDTDKKGSR